ncbi:MAG: NFACT family protein [Clostridia bacterium]|nr:NFACT family protein [Clostridia bacterium]
MPQDAFTLRRNALELNDALHGGRINKINQPEKEELSFIIYTGKRTVKLVLNVNASDCGVYFSEAEQENPLVAPNFCMLLRKHLQGAEILEVSQIQFERILAIRMNCTSDFSSCERVLYCEIMGKYSNLVLTENGVILGALKTAALDANCKRMILAGVKYALPAPQDKVDPRDIAALKIALAGEEGNARYLFLKVAGLAPCTAEQIAQTYRGGDYAEHVQNFIFQSPTVPYLVYRDGKPADFTAYAVEGGVPCESLSDAQCTFYTQKREKKTLDSLARKLSSAVSAVVKKQEKRLAQISERRRDCAGAEENRVKGELLTANLYLLSRGMKECVLDNYYDGNKLKIALDPVFTPAQNAQAYYKKYRKQKRTLEILAPQEAEVRAELDYAESLQALVSAAANKEDLKCVEEELLAAGFLKEQREKTRKKKEESTFRAFEKDGFRIFAGRNNLQNDKLLKTGAPNDMWLHAQKYHSCHVLIKTEGRAVPDSVLLFAAGVCARYSDGKGDKIPVDYCPLKHVKKPPKAKAGFVIYNEYKTILVAPIEI